MNAFNEPASEDAKPDPDEKTPSRSPDMSADGAEVDSTSFPERRSIDGDAAIRFLLVAGGSPLGPLFRFAASTGISTEALESLRWDDIVTFSNGVTGLKLGRSRPIHRDSSHGVIENRLEWFEIIVPLGKLATQALREQRAIQAEERTRFGRRYYDLGLVFHGPGGGSAGQILSSEHMGISRIAYSELGLSDLRDSIEGWMSQICFGDDDISRILGVHLSEEGCQLIGKRELLPVKLFSKQGLRHCIGSVVRLISRALAKSYDMLAGLELPALLTRWDD